MTLGQAAQLPKKEFKAGNSDSSHFLPPKVPRATSAHPFPSSCKAKVPISLILFWVGFLSSTTKIPYAECSIIPFPHLERGCHRLWLPPSPQPCLCSALLFGISVVPRPSLESLCADLPLQTCRVCQPLEGNAFLFHL